MCWLCDHPQATRQDYLDRLRQGVLEHGWMVQYVEGEPTPFAYTIGLHEAGLPELLITSVSPDDARRLLNTVADYMIHAREPAAGDIIELPDDWQAEFVAVSTPDAHMGFAIEMYGPEVRALQLAWRDADGHSPWCPDFNAGGPRQPVLGVRGPDRQT